MEARQDKKYATKDGLTDLREQLLDDIDGRLIKQKKEIIEEVSLSVAKTIGPIVDDHEKRIGRLVKHTGIST
jgi:hypothetical protein